MKMGRSYCTGEGNELITRSREQHNQYPKCQSPQQKKQDVIIKPSLHAQYLNVISGDSQLNEWNEKSCREHISRRSTVQLKGAYVGWTSPSRNSVEPLWRLKDRPGAHVSVMSDRTAFDSGLLGTCCGKT